MPQAKSKSSTTAPPKSFAADHPDVLVRTALEIRWLADRSNDISLGPKDEAGSHRIYREKEVKQLLDREDALRNYLTAVRTTTIEGALVQVEEIGRIVDAHFGFDSDENEKEHTQRKLERLLYSIEGFLRSTLPSSSAQKLLALYTHCNPWRPFEDRLAEIRHADEREPAAHRKEK